MTELDVGTYPLPKASGHLLGTAYVPDLIAPGFSLPHSPRPAPLRKGRCALRVLITGAWQDSTVLGFLLPRACWSLNEKQLCAPSLPYSV